LTPFEDILTGPSKATFAQETRSDLCAGAVYEAVAGSSVTNAPADSASV
jgi:hypothetical protein